MRNRRRHHPYRQPEPVPIPPPEPVPSPQPVPPPPETGPVLRQFVYICAEPPLYCYFVDLYRSHIKWGNAIVPCEWSVGRERRLQVLSLKFHGQGNWDLATMTQYRPMQWMGNIRVWVNNQRGGQFLVQLPGRDQLD